MIDIVHEEPLVTLEKKIGSIIDIIRGYLSCDNDQACNLIDNLECSISDYHNECEKYLYKKALKYGVDISR